MVSLRRFCPLLDVRWRQGLDAMVIADESESIVQVCEERQGPAHRVQVSKTKKVITGPALKIANCADLAVGVRKSGGPFAAPCRPPSALSCRPFGGRSHGCGGIWQSCWQPSPQCSDVVPQKPCCEQQR